MLDVDKRDIKDRVELWAGGVGPVTATWVVHICRFVSSFFFRRSHLKVAQMRSPLPRWCCCCCWCCCSCHQSKWINRSIQRAKRKGWKKYSRWTLCVCVCCFLLLFFVRVRRELGEVEGGIKQGEREAWCHPPSAENLLMPLHKCKSSVLCIVSICVCICVCVCVCLMRARVYLWPKAYSLV